MYFINEKYSTSIIPLNEYEIKFLNLNNVMNQKYFTCKSAVFHVIKLQKRERNLDYITIYYDIKIPQFFFSICGLQYAKIIG